MRSRNGTPPSRICTAEQRLRAPSATCNRSVCPEREPGTPSLLAGLTKLVSPAVHSPDVRGTGVFGAARSRDHPTWPRPLPGHLWMSLLEEPVVCGQGSAPKVPNPLVVARLSLLLSARGTGGKRSTSSAFLAGTGGDGPLQTGTRPFCCLFTAPSFCPKSICLEPCIYSHQYLLHSPHTYRLWPVPLSLLLGVLQGWQPLLHRRLQKPWGSC